VLGSVWAPEPRPSNPSARFAQFISRPDCKVCFQIIEKSTYDKHWAHAKGHRTPDTPFPPPFSDDEHDDQPGGERNSSPAQVERAPEYHGIPDISGFHDMSPDDPMEHKTSDIETLENVSTKEFFEEALTNRPTHRGW